MAIETASETGVIPVESRSLRPRARRVVVTDLRGEWSGDPYAGMAEALQAARGSEADTSEGQAR